MSHQHRHHVVAHLTGVLDTSSLHERLEVLTKYSDVMVVLPGMLCMRHHHHLGTCGTVCEIMLAVC